MTEEEKKAVEAKDAEAAAAKANEPSELEKKLLDKDTLIAKLTTDRDNYKKGMLKAKGKLKEDGTPEETETDEEKFDRMFNEKMLDTKISEAQKEKDEIYKQSLTRIKELETTIKNRTQISTTDSGTGSESSFKSKDMTLSEEKIAKFKSMGWDDKKIELYKKNLVKLK